MAATRRGTANVERTALTRAARQLSKLIFPIHGVIADLTGRRFSHWARFDRWRVDQPGGLVGSRSDAVYTRYYAKELEYWQNPPHGDENTVHGSEEHPKRAASLRQYWNQLLTGSPDKNHVQKLAELGPFRHALALAHCPGLETMMASDLAGEWTYNSITGRFTDSPLPPGKLTILTEDLNFLTLPEARYDLILAEGVLHHIVNIEHLLAQVARALTPDGVFFVMEYVGEERFKWAPEKRRFLNELLADLPLKYQRYKMASVDVMHLSRLSPFEAVTSTALPALLAKHFVTREVRTAYGVLFPMLEFLKEEYLCSENPALEGLLQADREAGQHGLLPTTLAGVFEKRRL